MVQQVSRRRIGRIMRKEGLVSNYTVDQFKPNVAKFNEDKIKNIVEHNFDKQPYLKVVISDLTYVRVGNRWHYLCVLVDLFNREIIGYNSGPNKDAALVKRAFITVQTNLSQIKIFHTDRGNRSPGSAKHHPQLLGNGYNNHRNHSSLGYLSSAEYRENTIKKLLV